MLVVAAAIGMQQNNEGNSHIITISMAEAMAVSTKAAAAVTVQGVTEEDYRHHIRLTSNTLVSCIRNRSCESGRNSNMINSNSNIISKNNTNNK
jgi:hypothetical protein